VGPPQHALAAPRLDVRRRPRQHVDLGPLQRAYTSAIIRRTIAPAAA
jgi:hypothetical protein